MESNIKNKASRGALGSSLVHRIHHLLYDGQLHVKTSHVTYAVHIYVQPSIVPWMAPHRAASSKIRGTTGEPELRRHTNTYSIHALMTRISSLSQDLHWFLVCSFIIPSLFSLFSITIFIYLIFYKNQRWLPPSFPQENKKQVNLLLWSNSSLPFQPYSLYIPLIQVLNKSAYLVRTF